MSSDRNKEIMAANIKKYMERKGVTNQQLCDDLNFKYTTFIDWTKAVTYPRMPKIEAMANYFGVLKSDLIEEKNVQDRIDENPAVMGGKHFEMVMDEDFVDLFEDYKKLDDTQKRIVADLVHNLAETKKEA